MVNHKVGMLQQLLQKDGRTHFGTEELVSCTRKMGLQLDSTQAALVLSVCPTDGGATLLLSASE